MKLSGRDLYEAKMSRLRPKLLKQNERDALRKKKARIRKKELMKVEKAELIRQLNLRQAQIDELESIRRRTCSCGRIKGRDPYTPGCQECRKSKYGTEKTQAHRRKWEDRGYFYWERPDPEPPLADQIIAEMVKKSRPLNVG